MNIKEFSGALDAKIFFCFFSTWAFDILNCFDSMRGDCMISAVGGTQVARIPSECSMAPPSFRPILRSTYGPFLAYF